MNMKRLPPEERPREKLFFYGKEMLTSAELLAILLRTGTQDKSALEIAHEILSLDERGILFLENCSPEELSKVKGMGKAKACQILAAIELGRRVATHPRRIKNEIANPDDIVQLFMEKMRYYKKEHFKVLLINAKGQIMEDADISIGDLCSTLIHPREVFCQAVKRSAASVVFVHNHPSGDPKPSGQDLETTARLVQAAAILGIKVLDHIIIGDGTYISLKSEGLM
ncbi:DNA repair protein RadC [Anaerovorax odorimutans]|uniref:DNA repair protein RadC n=1 Tax=Anaerovorax odorimutans TaxID=109327 RepID=A0ABT1RSA8_9FIRM|nr:DNA repair protein RadC [Anaerovorax odorimutans]MCQ4638084.1 DNA repair protein RadC [Anaerovorax odorimutans]